MRIMHRPEHENTGVDALSRKAILDCLSGMDLDEFVLQICTKDK